MNENIDIIKSYEAFFASPSNQVQYVSNLRGLVSFVMSTPTTAKIVCEIEKSRNFDFKSFLNAFHVMHLKLTSIRNALAAKIASSPSLLKAFPSELLSCPIAGVAPPIDSNDPFANFNNFLPDYLKYYNDFFSFFYKILFD